MCSSRKNAPSVPAAFLRSASARSARFSLAENWRRRPTAKTSGSRRAAPEALSTLALRAASERASEEESVDPFNELFGDEVMCKSYLYSKLPETGVPHHIGTEGGGWAGKRVRLRRPPYLCRHLRPAGESRDNPDVRHFFKKSQHLRPVARGLLPAKIKWDPIDFPTTLSLQGTGSNTGIRIVGQIVHADRFIDEVGDARHMRIAQGDAGIHVVAD